VATTDLSARGRRKIRRNKFRSSPAKDQIKHFVIKILNHCYYYYYYNNYFYHN